jgi:glycosyltransferase involved in cell wall biosynthesis
MKKQSNLSVIILTYNEQKHISRCIGSVSDIASDIFIVDAHSTDKTCELAAAQGAKVIRNKWVNYATQFNWALDNLPIHTDWVLRLDADEIVTGHLQKELASCIDQLPESIVGIYVNRRVNFWGRWIRYGGMYPMYVMRLFRFGFGYCEPRWMDEHMVITNGKSIKIEGDIIDDNLNNLGWWISKHNDYALREAIDMLNIKFKFIHWMASCQNSTAPGTAQALVKKTGMHPCLYLSDQ